MQSAKNIFQLFKRTIKTDFVKVSTWTAGATLIRMVASFISIKVVAKVIGPSGIALVGQFVNSIAMISSLSTGFISQGVTKYLAENSEDEIKQRLIVSNAVRVTIFSTILTSVLVIVFNGYIGKYIFNTNEYNQLIILLGISLFLYSFNTLLLSIINGFKLYKKFTIINVSISIVSLIVSILLIFSLGLYGALLNCVVSQTVIVSVTLFYIRKEKWFKWLFSKINFDKEVTKKLGGFVLMALVTALVTPYVQIMVRQQITYEVSLDAAGYWEGMNRISTMYLLLVTTSITTFYLPRLSEIKDRFLVKREVLKTMAIVLPVLALCCLSIYLLRDFIITVIFSHEFRNMRELFAAQMVGDFLRIASWLIAMLFWAKAMTKQFIITEIFVNISYVVLVKVFVNQYGVQGAVYAYALNYLLYLILVILIFRKTLFYVRPAN